MSSKLNRWEQTFISIASHLVARHITEIDYAYSKDPAIDDFIIHRAVTIATKMEQIAKQRQQSEISLDTQDKDPKIVNMVATKNKRKLPSQTKKILTQNMVKSWLYYDPSTGVFAWKKGRLAGQPAGHIAKDGAIDIQVKGRSVRAHKLAWFYMTGQWPSSVKHADGNSSNNVWNNLYIDDASPFNSSFTLQNQKQSGVTA